MLPRWGPSLSAGRSLIDMERVGEKRREHWYWLLYEVESTTGEVLSSIYARDQKDGESLCCLLKRTWDFCEPIMGSSDGGKKPLVANTARQTAESEGRVFVDMNV